jgi:hypothetical protein
MRGATRYSGSDGDDDDDDEVADEDDAVDEVCVVGAWPPVE